MHLFLRLGLSFLVAAVMAIGEKPLQPLRRLGHRVGRSDADDVEAFSKGIGEKEAFCLFEV